MRAVDAYLSRRAAAVWPGAVVTCTAETRTGWQLCEPREEPVHLGDSYRDARASLASLIAYRVAEQADEAARIRDRVLQERRATEHLLRVVAGEGGDSYARASDAWHEARRMTDEALG